MNPRPSHAAGPLAGIRILDISEGIAGPYAASLLGDLGADIVKVERPDGDWGRSAGRTLGEGLSAMYVAMNRNKRIVSLDLKRDGAIEVVRRLVRSSDVLISNYRPGAMERLGLSYDDCRAVRPGVVYCAISAFDTRGPYASHGGNDTGLQAISGFMSLNGTPDGEPVRAGIPVIDMTAAMFVSQAVLAALRTPEDSPHRHVEISLLNAAAALQTLAFTEYLNTGEAPARHGNQNPFISPAGAFRGGDGGHFTVACLKESHWNQLCELVERPELRNDPRYAGNARRVENRASLNAVLDEVFAARPARDWVEQLREHNVLCAMINDLGAVVADPGLGETLPLIDADADGTLRTLGHPVRFGGAFPEAQIPPSAVGSHTREILVEQGYGDEEIEGLIADGAAFAEPEPPEAVAGATSNGSGRSESS